MTRLVETSIIMPQVLVLKEQIIFLLGVCSY